MQDHRSAGSAGTVVASGWGLKVYVERGHLVVHDGVGRSRETRRFNRATSGLERLFVIGRTGFVTLDALRWIHDIGATFTQIDGDGAIVAMSSAERFHNTKLRRAQVLAAENAAGLEAMRALLLAKLERQVEVATRLEARVADSPRFGRAPLDPVPMVIARQLEALRQATTLDELRSREAVAGRWYWHTLGRVPVRFERAWSRRVPEHWYFGGPRTSTLSGMKSSRKATTPLHALMNYAYAILETEATIVLQAFGFDPSLGILHTDKRYRGSLAADLMEVGRPAADEAVLALLEQRELRRGDVYETREGVCRLGASVVEELAFHGPELRQALTPHAASLAETFVKAKGGRSSPPGRRRDRKAAGKGEKRVMAPRVR
jgi:CRISPR-associated endonuclease Cas1